MARIEPDVSVLVTPSYDKEAFPLLLHPVREDRVRKQVTIPFTDPHATYRLQAVNRNQEKEVALIRKEVATTMIVDQPYDIPFRMQAVLSEAIYGFTHSPWVITQKMHSDPVQAYNQYRLRGVSKDGFKSLWVYSELKDQENDLLLYEMLYEVMDQLLGIQDQSIDFWMDYLVSDVFIRLLQDHAPILATQIDPSEKVMASIIETLHVKQTAHWSPQEKAWVALGEAWKVIADTLKEEWQEQVVASMEEFALLMRKYQLFERYQEQSKDAWTLLLTTFIEDQIETVTQKSHLEVYVQNLEESGIYLTGVYDLRILREHVTAVNSPSLDDRFVTKFNDAVQLLSEPIVFEAFTTQPKEEVQRALRLVVLDLWGTLQTMDETWAELMTDLPDTHELSMQAGIVELEAITDDERMRYLLLQDVFVTLLSKEEKTESLVHSTLLDYVIGEWLDKRMGLQVDYLREETLSVMKFIERHWEQAITKRMAPIQETKQVSLTDQTHIAAISSRTQTKASIQAMMQDMVTCIQTKTKNQVNESKRAGVTDDWLLYASTLPEQVLEKLTGQLLDRWFLRALHVAPTITETLLVEWLDKWLMQSDETLAVSEKIRRQWLESFVFEWIRQKGPLAEALSVHPTDPSETLFKHSPRLAYPLWMQEAMDAFVTQHPMDYFFLEGNETVHFAMGSMDNGWPVGVFKLGTNTLKGEEQII